MNPSSYSMTQSSKSSISKDGKEGESNFLIQTQEEVHPWIEVDLKEVVKINKIRLLPPDQPNLCNYTISISKDPISKDGAKEIPARKGLYQLVTSMKFSSSDDIKIDNIEGRYIRIQFKDDSPQSISLQGFEIYQMCFPPDPPEDTKCSNGGFELSNFTGWTGATGSTKTPRNIVNGIDANQHKIISRSDFNEPYAQNIKFPCTGSYIARLGDLIANVTDFDNVSKFAQLSYDFTVSPDNADFFFRYALVLEDGVGSHSREDNPYFQYKFFKLDNNNNLADPISENMVTADFTNPFFERGNSTNRQIIYRNWTCVNIPLQQYMGQRVRVIFEVSDCKPGAHLGYAYIDGLCSTRNDNSPKAAISGKSGICTLADLVFDGSASCGVNQYTWSICELNSSGSEVSCSSWDFVRAPEKFEPSSFYTFVDGKRYRIKLTPRNDCINGTPATLDISIKLAGNKLAYKNLLVCGNPPTPVKMQGNNNCPGCQFTWSPFYRVLNSREEFPSLRGYIPPCHTSFTVTARDEDNCEFKQEDIDIFNVGNILLNVETDVDSRTTTGSYCYYKVTGTVQFECEMPQNKFSLTLSRSGRDEFDYHEIITSSDNKTYQYVFYVPTNQGSSNMILKVNFNYPNYVKVGDCELTKSFNLPIRDTYWGSLLTVNGSNLGTSMQVPNLFSPNGDGINDDFRAFSASGKGYKAFWYKAEIFNRWGSRIFSKEESTPIPTINNLTLFGDDQWIRFDGKFNGQDVPTGEPLTWYINMENCSNPRQYFVRDAWKGSVTPMR